LKDYLLDERELILNENIRFRVIGRREPIPENVLGEMDENIRLSAGNTGLTLCLAINYGSRTEILDAVRKLAAEVKQGDRAIDSIDETAFDEALYTAGMPEPDLLIRTAGEMRISNYLLWQISYAELWVTPLCWPDFEPPILYSALADFSTRNRRFGGLVNIQGSVS
jgi:undecaprenyl diphosphate synthase